MKTIKLKKLAISMEKMMKKIVCPILFTFFAFCSGGLALAKEPLMLKTAVDDVLDQVVTQQSIVGAVVMIAHDGKLVYQRAVGYADREAKIPMQENSIFRLASMTKPLVSIAALSLIDQGKLHLDDPVTRWLPDFQPKFNANAAPPEITIRQLLTHTAGLDYVFAEKTDGPYHQLGVSDGVDRVYFDLEENLRRLAKAPLLYQPGTQWHYSLAVDVLGAIVAKANQSSLEEAVQTLVARPLRMNDTSFTVTDQARLTVPYADNLPAPVRMTDPYVLPFPSGSAIVFSPSRVFDPKAYQSGGAGMVGTAKDYMKFLEAFRTGQQTVLTPPTLNQFTQNMTGEMLADMAGEGWGFGLGVAVLKDPKPTGAPMHAGTWGWYGAYGSNFFVDPKARLSVVILTNTTLAGMVGEFPDALKKAIYESDILQNSK